MARTYADATLKGVLDTQLAMEQRTGKYDSSFHDMLSDLKIPDSCHRWLSDAGGVAQLLKAYEALNLSEVELRGLRRASDIRVSKYASLSIDADIRRVMTMDKRRQFKLVSPELIIATAPEHVAPAMPLRRSQGMDSLIQILPPYYKDAVEGASMDIYDIGLDLHRRPIVWRLAYPSVKVFIESADGICCRISLSISRERHTRREYLLSDEKRVVKAADLRHVVDSVENFGSDNRAGLRGELHRVSAIRNRASPTSIIGLTIRIGRHIAGNADMIRDILFLDPTKSILILGGPGSGKTSLIRDVTRCEYTFDSLRIYHYVLLWFGRTRLSFLFSQGLQPIFTRSCTV